MRITTTILVIFTSSLLMAQHTFSIVAVDSVTGEVGSAGASCIAGSHIISDVHPGLGAIHTQSYWSGINQANASDRLELGDSPQEVIDFVVANDAGGTPEIRQYGAVAFDSAGHPSAAGYTGVNCFDYKNHIVGVYYAIQGNILLGQQILDSMEARFLNTSGDLADKLMAAMQGANVPSADTRCTTTSSLSSFIRVARPADSPGSFYLDIVIPNVPSGMEPIDTLQTRFDAWKNALGVNETWPELDMVIAPNPASGSVSIAIRYDSDLNIEFFTSSGQLVLSRPYLGQHMSIDTSLLGKGLIYYRVLDGESNVLKIGSFVVM